MAQVNPVVVPSAQTPQPHAEQKIDAPQLIGGKYKNMDEVVVANERAYQDTNEKINKLTQVLELALAPQPQPNYRQPDYGYSGVPVGQQSQGGQPASYADPYGRGEVIDPTAFITNPGKFLQERDDKLTGRIIQQVSGVVQEVVSNAMIVGDFKARHQDMIQHEPLVRSFMERMDQRIPLAKRLEDAATQTKQYLQTIRGSVNAAPSGGEHVEAPTTGAIGGGGGAAAVVADDGSEADLASYIQERNNDFAARFGINQKGE